MARKTKEQIQLDLHAEALKRFDEIQGALRDERLQCLYDRRFYSIAGAQWEGKLGEQFENRPKFEVNKCHLSVIRIINEYRKNRITVDFIAKDGSEDDFANVLDGRYRADEQDSGAQEAYDNAFEEAVGGGFGAWRLRPCYEDEDDDENEYQRIAFEPIYDADSSVFFDLKAKKQDKSDANYGFVIYSMPIEAYEDEYDDDVSTWPKAIHKTEFDWSTPDVIYLAEYYIIEKQPVNIHTWVTLDGEEQRYTDQDFEDDDQLEEMLIATGAYEKSTKKTTRKKVHKYLLNGNKIIEDCGIIPGKYIPIIPCYGKRWYVDNVERCMGHVRLSKDAQRLKNMQLSKLGETAAQSSIEKPIMTSDQVAGYEDMWSDDNVKNWPFLLTNPITDLNGNIVQIGPTAYTKPPQVPPAMAALLQITEQDMADLLGNQQSAEEIQPNISGKAIELIQNRLDMQTFIYMSNMKKAVKRSGEIWLSMAKEIYVEEGRNIKVLGPQKSPSTIELMRPVKDKETGEIEQENDFSKANHDVYVSIGPSTDSKRASTVRSLTGMMQFTQDPETMFVLSSMALMNMEGEGLEDLHKYFRKKLIRMGVIEPNEEEMKQLQAEAEAAEQQPPDPQSQYLQSAAMEAEARATKAQADTMLTVAKTKETEAETIKTLAEVDQKDREQTVSTLKSLKEIQQQDMQPAAIQPQIG